MSAYSYRQQVKAVLMIEIALLSLVFMISFGFWKVFCNDTLASCLGKDSPNISTFLFLSIIRPFVFTPIMFLHIMAGSTFGPLFGALLSAIGGTLATLAIFLLAKLLGERLVKPWLTSNLPATWQFLRSQDFKIVAASRFLSIPLPFVPYDLLSILFGALDFRLRSVLASTFVVTFFESYLIGRIASKDAHSVYTTLSSLMVWGLALMIPLVVFEFVSRKKGSSLWIRLKNMYRELLYEIQLNNDIVKRYQFDPEKPAVLLLYGFFSSRRVLTVLERLLTARGFQVMSFNLGGLLGVFFTRGIIDTAAYVDYKIKRQINRHGFKKIHVVAHSKGGLVAVWWLLKLGGHKFCNKVITMGTPFDGSYLTYLALVTPLGFLWRDVWQMRPGSSFLKALHETPIADGVKIHCIYSNKDKVSRGIRGVFKSRYNKGHVVPVPMHQTAHFEFLYKRDVADMLAKILKEEDANTGADRSDGDSLPIISPAKAASES